MAWWQPEMQWHSPFSPLLSPWDTQGQAEAEAGPLVFLNQDLSCPLLKSVWSLTVEGAMSVLVNWR